MNTERHIDLQQQCYEKKENIQRLEEEIREIEAKINIPKEANKTPESPKNGKSSRELRKHLLREISPIQMYTPASSYDHEERQNRHSWKARTSSSSEEGSQDQESINKAYTIEKVYAKHSKFSFKIKDPLSISWNKSQRRFVLRCPYYFDMETLLHKIQPADNYDPTLKLKTNLFLHLPGITILNKKGILFLFLPAQQWAGIFHVFHIKTDNGLTLYFSKKASLEQITIPKGKLLGYLYAIARLQE